MKRIIILVIFSISILIVKAQLPDISLYDIDNNYVELTDLQGENLTVVDFWATWCKPCLIAVPELSKLHSEFKDQGVKFIGINIDSPRNQSKVRPFSNSRGINYPVVLDPDQEAMQEMNVVVVPTLMIYDADGKLLFSHEGFKPGDQKVIREEIEKNLP